MAYDLAPTPSSGIVAQLCGDCHISNFGLFASPERDLVFDLNDFDETLPGPFEWDVKRVAASIVVAARYARLREKEARKAVLTALRVYREKILDMAQRDALDVWYSRVEASVWLNMAEHAHRKEAALQLARVQKRDRMRAFAKLTELVDGERRIVHDPPLIHQLDDQEAEIREWLHELFTAYHASLEDSRRHLLSRYRLVDVAHKVVGVGSVGMCCFVALYLQRYAGLCGAVLARAHARTGDAAQTRVTWANPIPSTRRWPRLPSATPTRTRPTTLCFARPSRTAGWQRLQGRAEENKPALSACVT